MGANLIVLLRARVVVHEPLSFVLLAVEALLRSLSSCIVHLAAQQALGLRVSG